MSAPVLAPPIENSYWVIAQRLLAGECPSGRSDEEDRNTLRRLCAAGINDFIDLTHSYERPAYHPWLPRGVRYIQSSIPDTQVPDDVQQMRQIQTYIRDSLRARRNLYIHCRAGIGRTGLVVGCYLTEQGVTGNAALKALNRLWKQSARSKTFPKIPQTPQQAAYIRNWPRLRQVSVIVDS
jgi:Dual specificity phosphatase, catalytic domain